jgi:hypothetical protein
MTDADINKFLDGFLAGDGETANDPKFEELAATVAATYAAIAWKTAIRCGAKEPPPPRLEKRHERDVLDVIMARSYPGERLDVSLARLTKAVQYLGFPTITAFSATAAYNTFTHLTETPYEPRGRGARTAL